MAVAQVLAEFHASLSQCDSLIAHAHQIDPAGLSYLPAIDRQQITVAAFLNTFIAWETFLEASLIEFMVGGATISGRTPTRYVLPRTTKNAQDIVKGVLRYFDYANHDNFRRIVSLYFENGYPYEPHLGGLVSELNDLKIMRNSSAHISSSTQNSLENLALRIFAQQRPGITLYEILTAVDPQSSIDDTVFLAYKRKLSVAAELIADG